MIDPFEIALYIDSDDFCIAESTARSLYLLMEEVEDQIVEPAVQQAERRTPIPNDPEAEGRDKVARWERNNPFVAMENGVDAATALRNAGFSPNTGRGIIDNTEIEKIQKLHGILRRIIQIFGSRLVRCVLHAPRFATRQIVSPTYWKMGVLSAIVGAFAPRILDMLHIAQTGTLGGQIGAITGYALFYLYSATALKDHDTIGEIGSMFKQTDISNAGDAHDEKGEGAKHALRAIKHFKGHH